MSDEVVLTDLTDFGELANAVQERRAQAESRIVRSGWNDPIAQAVRSFVRLGADSGSGAAWDDPGARCLSFDAKTATAEFLITTKSEDRHGDVVKSHGCDGRLDRYVKNPVVFFGHKSYGLPIGSAVDAKGACALHFTRDGLVSPVKFHLKTQESEDVCRLVEAGELRAASIGFIPIRAKRFYRRDDDSDDAPKNEVKFEPYVRFVFEEWELLEWSVVSVPANPDCVALRLSKGFGGRALAPAVAKYLEPFAAPSKAWSAGATLKSDALVVEPLPAVPKEFDFAAVQTELAAVAASLNARMLDFQNRVLAALALSNAAVDAPVPPAASAPAPFSAPGTQADPPASAPVQAGAESLRLQAQIDQIKAGVDANARRLRQITGRVD
jgi:HK97 family phage prohead protease